MNWYSQILPGPCTPQGAEGGLQVTSHPRAVVPTALLPVFTAPNPFLTDNYSALDKKTPNQNKEHIKMLQSNKQLHFKLFHWASLPS